jgi:hypothetical protein
MVRSASHHAPITPHETSGKPLILLAFPLLFPPPKWPGFGRSGNNPSLRDEKWA